MPFHNITAHRIACLALYKAFLRHIPHLPYSNTVKKQARSKIYKQFRKDRRIQGLTNIRAALTSAYENESLFRRAATGDVPSIALLTENLKALKALQKAQSLISTAPARPPPSFPPPIPPTLRYSRVQREIARKDPVARARRHKSIQILRRRTPYLTATNSFPLLRRPGRRQSLAVAMVLKKKTIKRQRRQDLQDMLEGHIDIAIEEDMWDARLWNMGLLKEPPWEERFEPEAVQAYDVVRGRLRAMDLRTVELTTRFKEIITREKGVKEERIKEYKRAKRQRLRQRARERKVLQMGEKPQGEKLVPQKAETELQTGEKKIMQQKELQTGEKVLGTGKKNKELQVEKPSQIQEVPKTWKGLQLGPRKIPAGGGKVWTEEERHTEQKQAPQIEEKKVMWPGKKVGGSGGRDKKI